MLFFFFYLARLKLTKDGFTHFFIVTKADVKSSSGSVAFHEQILQGLKYSLQIHKVT